MVKKLIILLTLSIFLIGCGHSDFKLNETVTLKGNIIGVDTIQHYNNLVKTTKKTHHVEADGETVKLLYSGTHLKIIKIDKKKEILYVEVINDALHEGDKWWVNYYDVKDRMK